MNSHKTILFKTASIFVISFFICCLLVTPVDAASKYGEDKPLTTQKRVTLQVSAGHNHEYIDASNGVRYQLYHYCMNGMKGSTPTNHSDYVTIDGVKYSLNNYDELGSDGRYHTAYANVIKKVNPASEIQITKVSFPTEITIKEGQTLTLTFGITPSNTTDITYASFGSAWGPTDAGKKLSVKRGGRGSYWKEGASVTLTGLKAGTVHFNSSLDVYNSHWKYQKSYSFTTKVVIVDKATADKKTANAYQSNNGSNSPAARAFSSGIVLKKVSPRKCSFKAKWKKASKKQQKKFSGYQIQYSTSPNFTTDVKTKSTTKRKASKVVIRRLKAKTNYYVRIRRFKKSGKNVIWTDWSNVKRVRTK